MCMCVCVCVVVYVCICIYTYAFIGIGSFFYTLIDAKSWVSAVGSHSARIAPANNEGKGKTSRHRRNLVDIL